MRKGEKKKKEPLYQVTPSEIEKYKRMGYQLELKREIGVDIGDRGIFIPDEEKA